MNTHIVEAQDFFGRIRAMNCRFLLLCRAGADTQILRGAPVPNVLVKVECRSNDFVENNYRVRDYWNAGDVLQAIGSPLAALVVSLLRLNHPECSLGVFLEKETFLKVLSMTKNVLQYGDLFAGRLGDVVAIPIKDDGTYDYEASFECRRRGEHSLPVSRAPLVLQLEQAFDATTSEAALEMRQRASNMSTEEQTQLAAEMATTSALLILPGTFARRTADRGRRRRSRHGPDDSRFAHRP